MRTKQARLTKEVKERARAIGCTITKAKLFSEGKHKLIGIHLLNPNQRELEDALDKAERDLFCRIIIHSLDSWAPGAMKQPRSEPKRLETHADRREVFKLIYGGAT